jgi:hypothetical protein
MGNTELWAAEKNGTLFTILCLELTYAVTLRRSHFASALWALVSPATGTILFAQDEMGRSGSHCRDGASDNSSSDSYEWQCSPTVQSCCVSRVIAAAL